MEHVMDELNELLRRFADEGARPTRADGRELQTLLEDRFPGGEGFPGGPALYEDLETAAACFRPGGGEFMYDEGQMAHICRAALAILTPGTSDTRESP
jgi:hypothetical protein